MRSAAFLLLLSALLPAEEADIVVYGGTSGGITAAIQAARDGRTAVLIEPTRFLGGLTTGGLGATDIGNKRAIGGMSREFYQGIHRHYSEAAHWRQQTREDYFARRPHGNSAAEDTMWTFEPHVASLVYDGMLKAAGDKVTVVHGERLDLKMGVVKEDGRIVKIVMESGREFTGKVFIDATYEGDLMAKAGVSYHVGREANATYGETLNGVQVGHARHHQFKVEVDPYVKKGDPSSGLLPGIEKDVPGPDGSGDRKVQAYNFRMCTTDAPENRRDWEKPEGYDERWYELALRNVEAGEDRISWAPTPMPNRKTDTNNNFAVSTDFIGQNWDYAEADYPTREKIWKAHESWQKGLMWTYAHHPRVPEKMRLAFQKFGLAKDEFRDNGNWPRQLYVREARRMVSDYVMTEKNCRRTEVVEDSVCLSASHIAYGSIRMEPVFMVMGQSAAIAAGLAIEAGTSVQEVPYPRLKERLLAVNQVLDFVPTAPVGRGVAKSTLPGIVIDDDQAELKGFGSVSTSTPGFVGEGYRHDGNDGKGTQSAKFTPDLPKAGRYRVALSYGPNPNRAGNVSIRIRHADGESTLTVNQKSAPSGDKPFHPLGTFDFKSGREGWVEISNAGSDGYVIVDAVQWLPTGE
jgi:hypothetical protein